MTTAGRDAGRRYDADDFDPRPSLTDLSGMTVAEQDEQVSLSPADLGLHALPIATSGLIGRVCGALSPRSSYVTWFT